ncbi:receptor-type tyrosine-protein phosphatase gamma-like protein, partial [Lates japonicus]
MQIYLYNSDDFDSLSAAIKERRIIAAMAVFFELGQKDNPAVGPIIQGLKGVVHHEKETNLRSFILRDLLPSSVDSYYRYTGSLTTPPCSKVVEWIIFSRPVYLSQSKLEAFYSIFTTEQQDHVKSVEYLRNNFRPLQDLGNRKVFKSAVKDAWQKDLTEILRNPHGTEASRVCSSARGWALQWQPDAVASVVTNVHGPAGVGGGHLFFAQLRLARMLHKPLKTPPVHSLPARKSSTEQAASRAPEAETPAEETQAA